MHLCIPPVACGCVPRRAQCPCAAQLQPGQRLARDLAKKSHAELEALRRSRGHVEEDVALEVRSRSLGHWVEMSQVPVELVKVWISVRCIYIYIPSVDNSLERISVKDTGDTQKEMGEDPLVDSVVAIVDNIYF